MHHRGDGAEQMRKNSTLLELLLHRPYPALRGEVRREPIAITTTIIVMYAEMQTATETSPSSA